MSMSRTASIVSGAALVLLGGLFMAYNVLGERLALPVPPPWRLWPLVISAVGLLFLLPPVLAPRQPVLGLLFIPGVPILITGVLATFTLVLPAGLIWGRFWPQIVLALAVGLGAAALYWRSAWLLLPAAVHGALGAALQFSALTGWWSAWSVLWAVIPLAVGIVLLGIGVQRGSRGLQLAGLLLSGGTLVGAVGLGALLSGNWGIVNAAFALVLIGAGVALAGLNVRRAPDQVERVAS